MADLPVSTEAFKAPVVAVAYASVCEAATKEQVQAAFQRIKLRLASTRFKSARPSQICGLVQLEMEGGKLAYTDLNGRYFILGLALDTQTGSPADAQAQVDRVISDREAALTSHPSVSTPR